MGPSTPIEVLMRRTCLKSPADHFIQWRQLQKTSSLGPFLKKSLKQDSCFLSVARLQEIGFSLQIVPLLLRTRSKVQSQYCTISKVQSPNQIMSGDILADDLTDIKSAEDQRVAAEQWRIRDAERRAAAAQSYEARKLAQRRRALLAQDAEARSVLSSETSIQRQHIVASQARDRNQREAQSLRQAILLRQRALVEWERRRQSKISDVTAEEKEIISRKQNTLSIGDDLSFGDTIRDENPTQSPRRETHADVADSSQNKADLIRSQREKVRSLLANSRTALDGKYAHL